MTRPDGFDPTTFVPLTPAAVLDGAYRLGMRPERVLTVARAHELDARQPQDRGALWSTLTALAGQSSGTTATSHHGPASRSTRTRHNDSGT